MPSAQGWSVRASAAACTRCAAAGVERRAVIEVLQDYFDIAKVGEHLCHEIHEPEVRRSSDELLSRLDPTFPKPDPPSPCVQCGSPTDRYNGQKVPRGWHCNTCRTSEGPSRARGGPISAADIRSTISSAISLLREKEVIDLETKEEVIQALEDAIGQVDHYRKVNWMRRR